MTTTNVLFIRNLPYAIGSISSGSIAMSVVDFGSGSDCYVVPGYMSSSSLGLFIVCNGSAYANLKVEDLTTGTSDINRFSFTYKIYQ